jgi:hypothetical protein
VGSYTKALGFIDSWQQPDQTSRPIASKMGYQPANPAFPVEQ